MLDPQQAQSLIVKIVNADISATELNKFIRCCAAFSASWLYHCRNSGKLHTEYQAQNDHEIHALALDAIGELFATNGEEHTYPELDKYYRPLLPEILADADEALLLTRRLVVSHTKQFLVRRAALNDPAGGKIYRNLTLVPKRSATVRSEKYGDEDYYYYQPNGIPQTFPQDFQPHLPEIPWENGVIVLEHLGARKNQMLPPLVEQFLWELQQESAYRHFIRRTLLFHLLKYFYGLHPVDLETCSVPISSSNSPADIATEAEQYRFLTFVKTYQRNEINTRYVAKNKLSESEATCYCAILDQYFEDLLLDGNQQKFTDYRAVSPLSQVDDAEWLLHRGRLEYLVKLGREALQYKFRVEFPSTH